MVVDKKTMPEGQRAEDKVTQATALTELAATYGILANVASIVAVFALQVFICS